MCEIDKAKTIMLLAHDGQVDKSGVAYCKHPEYVASKFKDKSEIVVALLHDVFEDSAIKIEELDFLASDEKRALELLTRATDADYMEYIGKIKENKLATAIKIEDLKHNMSDRGFANHPQQIAKYQKSLIMLTND